MAGPCEAVGESWYRIRFDASYSGLGDCVGTLGAGHLPGPSAPQELAPRAQPRFLVEAPTGNVRSLELLSMVT